MSRYDSLKFFKETNANKSHLCDKCRRNIEIGEIYYKESIGKVKPSPGFILRSFCVECYQKSLKT